MKLFLLLGLIASSVAYKFDFSFVKSKYVTPTKDGIRAALVPSKTGTPVISAYFPLPTNVSHEIYFKYDVLFEEGFQWQKGGKLPGLFGGSKKIQATGCVTQPLNAWSVRLMWTRGGAIQLYLYDQSRRRLNTACGNCFNTRKSVLVIGHWTTLGIYVKLNSGANKADGRVALFINGTKTLDVRQVELRGVDAGATIDWVLFNVFYGGHDPSWSPTKTTYIQFRKPSF